MNKPVLTFFNNKGGVGKTTLVYHVAHMLALKNFRVLVVDADPQANLSSAFLSDEKLQEIWDSHEVSTLYQAVKPIVRQGNFSKPRLQIINDPLQLLVGDLSLSSFEDHLSEQWGKANDDNAETYGKAFDVLTAFWRCAQASAADIHADLIIFDIGPNLGAINRSILIGTDHVIVPLNADLFSLRGLQNLGPALIEWQSAWQKRTCKKFDDYPLPKASMKVLGYIAMQHQERLSRPVQAYVQWLNKIPKDYRQYLLKDDTPAPNIDDDPHSLAKLRHYKSIIPIGQEARKPIFSLQNADGVSGSQMQTVSSAYQDFSLMVDKIIEKANLQRSSD